MALVAQAGQIRGAQRSASSHFGEISDIRGWACAKRAHSISRDAARSRPASVSSSRYRFGKRGSDRAAPSTLCADPNLVSPEWCPLTAGLGTAAASHPRLARRDLIGSHRRGCGRDVREDSVRRRVRIAAYQDPRRVSIRSRNGGQSAVAALRRGVSLHERVRHNWIGRRRDAAGGPDARWEAAAGGARACRRCSGDGAGGRPWHEHDRDLHRERRGGVCRRAHWSDGGRRGSCFSSRCSSARSSA